MMINQRMEINHLKAQLARCVAGRDMAENVLDGNVPSANVAIAPTLSVAILTLTYYVYVLRQRVRKNKSREKDMMLSSRHILSQICATNFCRGRTVRNFESRENRARKS